MAQVGSWADGVMGLSIGDRVIRVIRVHANVIFEHQKVLESSPETDCSKNLNAFIHLHWLFWLKHPWKSKGEVEFPGSGLKRTSLSLVAMGRATLLRHASLLSCNEISFEDKLAQLRKELVERYLNKYGFPSINEPREVAEGSRVRMEPLCAIHLAAMKGDPGLLKLLLVEGADPDETFQGYNALDIAEAENQNGSHHDVIEVLKDALRVRTLRL
jgi:hypothetical protein